MPLIRRMSPSVLCLALLPAVLGLAAGPARAATTTFGETGLGTHYYDDHAGQVVTCKATCGANGTVTSISFYLYTVENGSQVDVALYTNTSTASGDFPNVLLTSSSPVTVSAPNTWYLCPLGPAPVEAGKKYWLSFRSNSSGTFANGFTLYQGDTERTRLYSSTWGTGYPVLLYPAAPLSTEDWRFSLYATVALFTPTPTATRTRTVTPTPAITSVRSPTPTRTATPVRSPAPTATLAPTLQPGLREDLNERTLIVYPIPVRSGPLSLTFLAPDPGRAEFVIYNSAYQVIDRFSREVPAAGPRTETWPSDALAPGVYLCRLSLDTDAGRTVFPAAKFVVVK